jgi:hypothetical protein
LRSNASSSRRRASLGVSSAGAGSAARCGRASYPGSAFVLDLKGENYAVTARARRAAGQDVFVIDPYTITGAGGHSLNWLDTLDADDPDVVSRAGSRAGMLVVRSGFESEPHWNDTARDLLRGFLVHVAGLPAERRNMAELRAILTAPEDQFAEILADMLAAPARGGQRLVSGGPVATEPEVRFNARRRLRSPDRATAAVPRERPSPAV